MDDLTAQFAKMQAHIANLEKRLGGNDQAQSYGMGNQTKAHRTNFSERAQQFDKSKVQCYKCNKYGHYQNKCINESRSIPQQTILRCNVNIIGQEDYQWSEDDYYKDDYWELSNLEDMEREEEEEYKEPLYFG